MVNFSTGICAGDGESVVLGIIYVIQSDLIVFNMTMCFLLPVVLSQTFFTHFHWYFLFNAILVNLNEL